MTVEELIQRLNMIPKDTKVLVEVRAKTGYDEGDKYECEVEGIWHWSPNDKVMILLGKKTLVGGW